MSVSRNLLVASLQEALAHARAADSESSVFRVVAASQRKLAKVAKESAAEIAADWAIETRRALVADGLPASGDIRIRSVNDPEVAISANNKVETWKRPNPGDIAKGAAPNPGFASRILDGGLTILAIRNLPGGVTISGVLYRHNGTTWIDYGPLATGDTNDDATTDAATTDDDATTDDISAVAKALASSSDDH